MRIHRRWIYCLIGFCIIMAGVSWTGHSARTQFTLDGDATIEGPLLDLADYEVGAIMEGDGPAPERFAPRALSFSERKEQREDDFPAPEGLSLDFTHYPSSEEIHAFILDLEEHYPRIVDTVEVGKSWEGRPILGVRLTKETSGLGEPMHRPAMYMDGQHHARELISAQVTLYTLWWLAHHYGEDPLATYLLDTRAVYSIPSVNVDGNDIAVQDYQSIRKTANPECCDDDGDGKIDEDFSQGYGYNGHILRRYEFEQDWADAHPDDPFVDDWYNHTVGQPETLGRYTGAYEGPIEPVQRMDMDGDEQQNEDEIGGVDANRNYDWFWEEGVENIRRGDYHGPEVWSEPEVRAVRDFTANVPHLATALSYHSGVDLLLYPWGYSEEALLPDAALYELLSRKGSQLTEINGFDGTVRTWTARGLYGASGSTMDYLYGVRGIMSWSPEVYSGSGMTIVQRLGATGIYTVGQSTAASFNPPGEEILAVTDRWNRYALYLLAATPNLELIGLDTDDEALVLTLFNDGVMPVSIHISVDGASGARYFAHPERVYHAEPAMIRLPLSELAMASNRIQVRAHLESGTNPHFVETMDLEVSISPDGSVELLKGELIEAEDLSVHFEGWWAGDEWNDPKYRCPVFADPCPPEIPATPPATPDPSAPTPTLIHLEPEAPGATATDMPRTDDKSYLPWGES